MLSLITGGPGNGKTALVVKMLSEIKDRPIFVMGIPELKIPHQPVPPLTDWTHLRPSAEDENLLLPYFDFPANSLIVIDEAQNVYRPRPSASKVPDIVAALETHRHTGIDIWLVTQHPSLIDANVRRLIRRHIHIRVTPFGRYRHEWTECGDPDQRASRELSRTDRYSPPKDAFALYKSAEAHTVVKVRKPIYYYLFIICFIGVCLLAWRVYHRIVEANNISPTVETKKLSELGDQPRRISHDDTKTASEYLKSLNPRIQGLEHTAPIYDKATEVVEAPVPAACYLVRSGGSEDCRCINQQGSRYAASADVCRSVIQDGFFNPFARKRDAIEPVHGDQLVQAELMHGGEPFPPSRRPALVDASVLR